LNIRKIAYILLILTSFLSGNVRSDISSIKIAKETIAAIDECADYCFVGSCAWLRCRIFPPGCSVELDPKIRHKIPELVVSAFPESGENPWTDVRAILAPPQKALANTVAGAISNVFNGGGNAAERTFSNDHVNLIYKEVDAIGHPLASAINIVAKGDIVSIPPLQNGTGGGNGGGSIPPELIGIQNTINQILQTIDIYNTISELVALAEAFDAGFDAINELSGGIWGGSFICPGSTTSFVPYFMSTVDYFGWRYGIPDMFSFGALVPGVKEIGSFPFNTWGNTMPRAGYVTQHSDPKAAAVVAQRAADIVTRPSEPHVYMPLTGNCGKGMWCSPGIQENDSTYEWQMLDPISTGKCEVFGTNDVSWLNGWGGGKGSDDGGYVFNLWREKACCTNRSGVYLYSLDLVEICL